MKEKSFIFSHIVMSNVEATRLRSEGSIEGSSSSEAQRKFERRISSPRGKNLMSPRITESAGGSRIKNGRNREKKISRSTSVSSLPRNCNVAKSVSADHPPPRNILAESVTVTSLNDIKQTRMPRLPSFPLKGKKRRTSIIDIDLFVPSPKVSIQLTRETHELFFFFFWNKF